MAKMIQIRHVPDALHRQLKQRAAGAGMNLSDFLRRELEQIAAQPSWDEIMERLEALEPIRSDESVADAVRAEREGR